MQWDRGLPSHRSNVEQNSDASDLDLESGIDSNDSTAIEDDDEEINYLSVSSRTSITLSTLMAECKKTGSKTPGNFLCTPEGLHWNKIIREGKAAADDVRFGGPDPQKLDDGTCITARYWGIARQQIKKLYRTLRKNPDWRDEDTVAIFVEKFVRPLTCGTGRGLSLNLNQERPKEVTLMVSHAWAENAKDFFEDVLRYTYDHEVAYICFLANYQGTPEEIDRQLGKNIQLSPFTQVIQNGSCERLLVIPNETLKKSGQGLYSRLWCDLEIKTAADAGIPIQIPTRNTLAHLLGAQGGSSRHARCGNPVLPMNQDEKLIREAIETMPPETARYHAFAWAIVASCAAYSPLVFANFFHTVIGWCFGLMMGFLLGVLLTFFVTTLIRPSRRDGYATLDKIIKGAANGFYDYKRPKVNSGLISFFRYAAFFAFADTGFRLVVMDQRPRHCAFIGLTEGIAGAFVMWTFLNLNALGLVTGVFVVRPLARKLVSFALFLGCISGAGVSMAIAWEDRPSNMAAMAKACGGGTTLGLLAGLCTFSAYNGRYGHALNFLFMLVVVVCEESADLGLSHEIIILLLGFGAVQVRPEWGARNRIAICVLNALAICALLLLGSAFGGKFNTLDKIQAETCSAKLTGRT